MIARTAFLKTIILSSILTILPTYGLDTAEAAEKTRDRMVSIGGGNFSPSDGESGSAILGQFLRQNGNQRFGMELEYRDFEVTIFDVPKVETQSFTFRGVWTYVFRPEGITPYIGGGVGFSVNSIDGDRVEQARPEIVSINDVGIGFGIMGLIGIEAPVTDSVLLFAEGRISADYQLTKTETIGGPDDEEFEFENLGGSTISGGIRFRF